MRTICDDLAAKPGADSRHQRVSMAMAVILHESCPEGLEVMAAPLDVAIADDTVMQPDLLVARRSDFTERDLPTPPLLAVEILSPSTRLIDLNLKKALFEKAGCLSYWVIDPLDPHLIAWDLVDGAHVEVADVHGEEAWRATNPFAVEICPPLWSGSPTRLTATHGVGSGVRRCLR